MMQPLSCSLLHSWDKSGRPLGERGGDVTAPRRPAPEFLRHLTKMLSDKAVKHLIEWDKKKIVVHDPKSVKKTLLCRYFHYKKYREFERQLSDFGFKKHAGKGRMDPCSYEHNTAKGDLTCLLFVRKMTKGAAVTEMANVAKKESKDAAPSKKLKTEGALLTSLSSLPSKRKRGPKKDSPENSKGSSSNKRSKKSKRPEKVGKEGIFASFSSLAPTHKLGSKKISPENSKDSSNKRSKKSKRPEKVGKEGIFASFSSLAPAHKLGSKKTSPQNSKGGNNKKSKKSKAPPLVDKSRRQVHAKNNVSVQGNARQKSSDQLPSFPVIGTENIDPLCLLGGELDQLLGIDSGINPLADFQLNQWLEFDHGSSHKGVPDVSALLMAPLPPANILFLDEDDEQYNSIVGLGSGGNAASMLRPNSSLVDLALLAE